MGMFDYRNYSREESAELADTAFKLATLGQLDRIYGIQVASLANELGTILPHGALANQINIAPPAGWSIVGPASLGLSADAVDFDGYYVIASPLTGQLYSGPQAQIYEERDASGAIIRLSVTFVGTNSPVDLADYTQLNSGEIAPNMNPLLSAVRDYAVTNGVLADDVIVTGYSLGAAYTNVMAKYADVLADGFFAGSSYIAYAVPYTYEGDGRVLNIGFENDIVHRAAADFPSFQEAVDAAPGLIGPDYRLQSSTDNLILFGDDYANPAWPFGPFALYNIPGGWAAHVAGITSDVVTRITGSAFYEETERDSLVIVSNLTSLTRGVVWVEDLPRPSDRHDHVGHSAFLIGSEFGDRLRGREGNDYIDAMGGNDTIRPGEGQNRIEGGSGVDTLELAGQMRDWSVSHLADGTTALFSKSYGLNIVSEIENVRFLDAGLFGRGRHYAIESDRLEDLTWNGIFERLDQDISLAASRQGTPGDDALSGSRVFGLAGDDTLTGTARSDLLYGGSGDDRLDGGTGDDALFGGEGNDIITGGGGNDLLNGGLGHDLFVFDADVRGRVTIADFRLSDVEQDMILIEGGFLRTADEVLARGVETEEGLLLRFGSAELLVGSATRSSLMDDMVYFI